jgi:hypothetical protein
MSVPGSHASLKKGHCGGKNAEEKEREMSLHILVWGFRSSLEQR